jgi:hypothetical protein
MAEAARLTLNPKTLKPCRQADSWPEVARRFLALVAASALARGNETSGGLGPAMGNPGHSHTHPLALLDASVAMQFLTAGAPNCGGRRSTHGLNESANQSQPSLLRVDGGRLAAKRTVRHACWRAVRRTSSIGYPVAIGSRR